MLIKKIISIKLLNGVVIDCQVNSSIRWSLKTIFWDWWIITISK
jgi:hypothetical protein